MSSSVENCGQTNASYNTMILNLMTRKSFEQFHACRRFLSFHSSSVGCKWLRPHHWWLGMDSTSSIESSGAPIKRQKRTRKSKPSSFADDVPQFIDEVIPDTNPVRTVRYVRPFASSCLYLPFNQDDCLSTNILWPVLMTFLMRLHSPRCLHADTSFCGQIRCLS